MDEIDIKTFSMNEVQKMVSEACKPENIILIARGEENKKEDHVKSIDKYGMHFYLAGRAGFYGDIIGEFTDEEYTKAVLNTSQHARIGSLDEYIKSFPDYEFQRVRDFTPDGSDLYILTNEDKCNGAGVFICEGVLETIRQKIGNFWIFPSSIHELILCPVTDKETINKHYAEEMVRDINRGFVIKKEQLSDRVFYYDGRIH